MEEELSGRPPLASLRRENPSGFRAQTKLLTSECSKLLHTEHRKK